MKKQKSNLILHTFCHDKINSFDSFLTENSDNLWNMAFKMQNFLFPSQPGKTNALFGEEEIIILSAWKFAIANLLKNLETRDHQCYIREQRFSTMGNFASQGAFVNVWRHL